MTLSFNLLRFVSRLFFVGSASLVVLAQVALAQTALTSGRVGITYLHQITTNPAAAAGTVYGATGLPPGLSVNSSDGKISGTPTTAGTFVGAISLASGGTTNNYAISILIQPPTGTPTITGAASASGQVGVSGFSYAFTVSADGALSVNASGLPPGLALATTSSGGFVTGGVLSGTPTAAGTYTVALSANNSVGTGAAKTVTIVVSAALGTPVISSRATDSGPVNAAYSYQITATNSPSSYSAAGLPVGLALNSASGVISGTPTIAGVYTVTLTATNITGTSPAFQLALTVGALPSITSPLAASGTVGSAFRYTLAASNSPTSFNVTGLQAGFSVDTSLGIITGQSATAGVITLTVSANNATGTGPSSSLVITISVPASGGGGGGTPPSGGGGAVIVTAPTITAQPQSQSVSEGTGVVFSVSATGSSLNFQWFKDGVPLSGALSAAYTLAGARAADAGNYTVYVSNINGGVTSSSATLTVTPLVVATPPVITSQPVAAQVAPGGSATFSVAVSGTAPFSYQWRKDGAALSGATNAALSLLGVTPSQAGSYSVAVANAAGSVTSNSVALVVASPTLAGTYFGSFVGNGGSFGLLVRSDRTGVFLGYASASRVALYSRDLVVDAGGRFSVTQRSGSSLVPPGQPVTAAAESDITITGLIASDGSVSGAVPVLNLTFAAPAAATGGATAGIAGFYQAGVVGSSGQSLTLIGSAGEALWVTLGGTTADGGRGTVSASGTLAVTTAGNASVAGTIAQGALTATIGSTTYAGSSDPRNEKLINISTRSFTGTATDTLIAGFVIAGTEPKPVLVRAIGPTLSTFGVDGALGAVRLEVFRGATSLAVGTDWGAAANNPNEVVAVAARVGAFALPANSRDAALVLSLTPGNYSAVVTGQSGASGVALVEVYDATVGTIPPAQRVVNIATRATAGAGENALIAGFYVSGTVPKRVLIRGIGPGLAQFGVTGVLARPLLSVAAGVRILAQNTGLANSVDAAAIAAASTQVGAFALPANAVDAAILIHLAPGAYTAQLSAQSGGTGVALIEVYEVP